MSLLVYQPAVPSLATAAGGVTPVIAASTGPAAVSVLQARAKAKLGWNAQNNLYAKTIEALRNPGNYLDAKRGLIETAANEAATEYSTTFGNLYTRANMDEKDADKFAQEVANQSYRVKLAIIDAQYPDQFDSFAATQGMSQVLGGTLGTLKLRLSERGSGKVKKEKT